jgi:hypothetical protein
VEYSTDFLGWEAAVAAGMDMERWEAPDGYDPSLKAKIVAWYLGHSMVEAHIQDAAIGAGEKRRGKGRK